MSEGELLERIEALEKELMLLRSQLWFEVQDYLHPYRPYIPEPQRKYELIAPYSTRKVYTSVGPARHIPCSTVTITSSPPTLTSGTFNIYDNIIAAPDSCTSRTYVADSDVQWSYTNPSTDVGMPRHPAALEV